MKCPDHFLSEKKISEVYKNFRCDGVKNNNEEIFSAADFLHKFSLPG